MENSFDITKLHTIKSSMHGYNKKEVDSLFQEQADSFQHQLNELTIASDRDHDTITQLKRDNKEAIKNYNTLLEQGDSKVEKAIASKNAEIAKISSDLEKAKELLKEIHQKYVDVQKVYQQNLDTIKQQHEKNQQNLDKEKQDIVAEKDKTIASLNSQLQEMKSKFDNYDVNVDAVRDEYEEKLRSAGENTVLIQNQLKEAKEQLKSYQDSEKDGEIAHMKRALTEQLKIAKSFDQKSLVKDNEIKNLQEQLKEEQMTSASLGKSAENSEKSMADLLDANSRLQTSRKVLSAQLKELYAKYIHSLEMNRCTLDSDYLSAYDTILAEETKKLKGEEKEAKESKEAKEAKKSEVETLPHREPNDTVVALTEQDEPIVPHTRTNEVQ